MNCSSITTQKLCCEGDLEVLLSNMSTIADAERWSIAFFVGPITCSNPQKYVIASYDGTNYNNCKLVDDGNVLCFFKNPQLGCGQLCYKLYLGVSDENFAPSLRDDVFPVATNYELGPWPTDSVQAELDLLVLSGIINAQIVGATAESLPAGSEPTVTLGGTATKRTFAFGIPAGADGPNGHTPVLTANPDGTILSDGVVLTDVLKVAAENSDTQTARVETLADNPPKIVEVDGMTYWAFYDLETKKYVTSQYRADDGTIVQQVEGADVSLDVVGGTMYVCGELTSLTIASVENSTKPSIIRFTSGATATQFSFPDDFNITGWSKPEENRNYTICILFGAGNMTYDE